VFDPGFSETEEVRVMRVNEIRYCCSVDRVKMERMLRVQIVKLTGPGFNSMSPQRRSKAKKRGLRH